MKKIKFITLVSLVSVSSVFANTWVTANNTCQNRVSFFGLVEVWTGSITQVEYDDFGRPTGNTRTLDCTPDGNWDWFW